jgi:hypothetical protein
MKAVFGNDAERFSPGRWLQADQTRVSSLNQHWTPGRRMLLDTYYILGPSATLIPRSKFGLGSRACFWATHFHTRDVQAGATGSSQLTWSRTTESVPRLLALHELGDSFMRLVGAGKAAVPVAGCGVVRGGCGGWAPVGDFVFGLHDSGNSRGIDASVPVVGEDGGSCWIVGSSSSDLPSSLPISSCSY